MPKLQIWAKISEAHLRAYESEAQRRGVSVESLVEQTVNQLMRDLERGEQEDADRTLSVS